MFLVSFFYALSMCLNCPLISLEPVLCHVVMNSSQSPSLVNSIDFHPQQNLCCVTFTHNNKIEIYKIDEEIGLTLFQTLQNPDARLSHPQHAVFSKDGKQLIVANWSKETFNIYHVGSEGVFQKKPRTILKYPKKLRQFKPHGIAFSQDGGYFAVAFGASKDCPRGVALFRVQNLGNDRTEFKLVHLLQSNAIIEGIPKGITFSPDGSSLAITFAITNSIAIYQVDWVNEQILSTPIQVLEGMKSMLSRPEDVKFSADGTYCAVSNSSEDTITFYQYDKESNRFPTDVPFSILDNSTANLSFPHGLSFSADGKYLGVTQFGPVKFSHNDDLEDWGEERRDSISIFKLSRD